MFTLIIKIRSALLRLHGDTLFRNSFYLMLATAVVAGFGFFFWLINAHLFSTADIGVATTLISVMNLIALLSLVGFSAAFIRFLPTANNRNEQINTGFILVTIASILFSTLFVVLVKVISPQLAFIQEHFWFAIIFIIACVMNTLNVLTDSVFLANRQAKFSLIIDTIFSIFKILAPFAFIGWGAIGIFTVAALAQTLGTVLSILALIRWFGYRPRFTIDRLFVSTIWRYSAANYFSSALNLLPATVLPIIVINYFGPEPAAYFYIATMVTNLLYAIPYATTRSLFVEGSHDELSLEANVRKSIVSISFLLIPAIVILLFTSGLILQIFGKAYESGGVDFLRLMVLAGITVSAYALSGAIFLVKKDSRAIILSNLVYSVSVLSLSYLLLPFGLTGIGIAWISGNAIAAISGFALYRHNRAYLITKLSSFVSEKAEIVRSKIAFLRAWAHNGFKRRVILFYPELPRMWHVLHPVCHVLGISISNNSSKSFDRIIAFSDTTIRTDNPKLRELATKYQVINANCGDISKKRVEEVFKKIFGYEIAIDPETYQKPYVRKSNGNATHDGKIMHVPSKPEKGFVYQKLINNESSGDLVVEMRAFVFKELVPVVLYRYKSIKDRFNHTLKAELVASETAFSTDELKNIIRFCKEFGLDYGELDVLRDTANGKIYIVDVNNTPGHPSRGVQMSKAMYDAWLNIMAESFSTVFLKSKT